MCFSRRVRKSLAWYDLPVIGLWTSFASRMYIFLQMQTSLQFVLINGILWLFKANDDCVKLWTPFVIFFFTQLLSAPTVSSCERVSPLSAYRCLFSSLAIYSLFRWYFSTICKKDYAILSFPLPASLCFSFFLFIGSHRVWFPFFLSLSLSLSLSFLQSRVLFFLSLVLFLFLFSPVLFLLVFENINRTRGFVTCENCCRKHTETARKKSRSSMGLNFYLSQLSCFCFCFFFFFKQETALFR